MTSNRSYRHTVEVWRKEDFIDADGVQRKGTDVKVASCLGNLQTLSGDSVIIGDSQNILANYRLFMPTSVKLKQKDVLKINGVDYTIYLIDDLMTSHQEVLLRNKI